MGYGRTGPGTYASRRVHALRYCSSPLKCPAAGGRLKGLAELHVSRNELTALPEKLWNLPALELLNLGENRLTAISDEIVLKAASVAAISARRVPVRMATSTAQREPRRGAASPGPVCVFTRSS